MRLLRCFSAAGLLASGFAFSGSLLLGQSSSATTVPSCVSGHLTVSLGQPQGAAGTIYYPIVFTNKGGECAIWGVPTLQPVNGVAHLAVGPPARNTSLGMMPVRHLFARGHSVSVAFGVVETGNYTPSTCVARSASGVMVSLAPFVRPTFVHLSIMVCTKRASTTTQLLASGITGY